MNYEPIRIGEKETTVPIIQGGMGVGVSLSGLASAVANCGGIGVISGVQIGFREDDFDLNSEAANVRAMIKEINLARELSPNGIIGMNLMVAIKNYDEMAIAAANTGVDLIISGAGLPSDLPKFIKGTNTKIAPIVSSGKAATLIIKLWKRRHDYYPDLIIVEGPEAGGHLGFSFDELENAKDDLYLYSSLNREEILGLQEVVLTQNEFFLLSYNQKLISIKQISDLQCSTINQMQLAKYIEVYDLDAHIEKIKHVYKKRRDVMMSAIKEYFPKEVGYNYPDGGLFTWIEFPEYINGKDLAIKAMEQNVAFVPGGLFYPNGGHENTARLNFSSMGEEKIIEGIKRLANVIKAELK